MADIKGLSIFGKGNIGLDKIKDELNTTNASKEQENIQPTSIPKRVKSNSKKEKKKNVSKVARGVGAPITRFDRIYAAKQPLKLSALLNATSRVLVEKYETNLTRDEILRKALDEYIKQNLSQEDKQDLFNNVIRDLELFREKYPTVAELDEHDQIIQTVEEIEENTQKSIRKNWGLKK